MPQSAVMRSALSGRGERVEALRHAGADGQSISYEVIRSANRRRTIAICVRDGSVIVRAPLHVAGAEIEAFIQRRTSWIASALVDNVPARVLAQGQVLPLANGTFTLVWERSTQPRNTLVLRDGVMTVRLAASVPIGTEISVVTAQLSRWYVERARERVDEAVQRWAPVLGSTPAAVFVRNQRSRWGSCARDGSLRFNWRLAMVTDALLDYVVVHELAHLLHPNHSPAFWSEVFRALPDYDKRRAELKRFSSPL